MSGMGIDSRPVNGAVANGHAAPMVPLHIPPELQARQGGPVASWPKPAMPADAAVKTGWWSRRVTPALRAIFAHRGWLAAIPVILVNAVAFSGQLAFLRHHLPWTPAGQVLVAVTLESVAVYLAWQAHLALAADDSALRLRLSAYGFAAVIGVMNYSHWMAPHWRPTFTAVTFGLMSVSSPWLWSVHSRRASRDALKARGLIEPHAVRLGATRWTWHPVRSWRVMFRATWQGENDPAAAIALPAMKAAEAVAASAADDGPDDGSAEVPAPPPVMSEPPRQERQNPAASAVKTPSPSKPPSKSQPGRPSSGRARAVAVIKEDAALTDAEVAERAGVSESTARRARTAGKS
jgi:hypothetical protein